MQNLKFAFSSIMAPQDAVLLDHDWDYYRCLGCRDYGLRYSCVSSGPIKTYDQVPERYPCLFSPTKSRTVPLHKDNLH